MEPISHTHTARHRCDILRKRDGWRVKTLLCLVFRRQFVGVRTGSVSYVILFKKKKVQ